MKILQPLVKAAVMLSGCLLVFSGLLHASNPYAFMHSIASYRFAPTWLVGLLGLLLPYVLLTVGTCLCLGLLPRVSSRCALILSLAFVILQVAVLARGLEIDCGCFGQVSSPVSLKSIVPSGFIVVTSMVSLCVTPGNQVPRTR
ncbi:MAG: MauE/DoxX family redox-associated membrane protein [Planctomycetota bacterium]